MTTTLSNVTRTMPVPELIASSKLFLVFVRTISGKTVAIHVSHNDTVADVKDQLSLWTGIPSEEQQLIFGRHLLADSRYLHEYDIQQESSMHLTRKLRGGDADACGWVLGILAVLAAIGPVVSAIIIAGIVYIGFFVVEGAFWLVSGGYGSGYTGKKSKGSLGAQGLKCMFGNKKEEEKPKTPIHRTRQKIEMRPHFPQPTTGALSDGKGEWDTSTGKWVDRVPKKSKKTARHHRKVHSSPTKGAPRYNTRLPFSHKNPPAVNPHYTPDGWSRRLANESETPSVVSIGVMFLACMALFMFARRCFPAVHSRMRTRK